MLTAAAVEAAKQDLTACLAIVSPRLWADVEAFATLTDDAPWHMLCALLHAGIEAQYAQLAPPPADP